MPSAVASSSWRFGGKSKAGGVPQRRNSMLAEASWPSGTSSRGRLGMIASRVRCSSSSAASRARSDLSAAGSPPFPACRSCSPASARRSASSARQRSSAASASGPAPRRSSPARARSGWVRSSRSLSMVVVLTGASSRYIASSPGYDADDASRDQERRHTDRTDGEAKNPESHIPLAPPYLPAERFQLGIGLMANHHAPDRARDGAERIATASHVERNTLDRRKALQIRHLFRAHTDVQRNGPRELESGQH